jgi:hypothetical protein
MLLESDTIELEESHASGTMVLFLFLFLFLFFTIDILASSRKGAYDYLWERLILCIFLLTLYFMSL